MSTKEYDESLRSLAYSLREFFIRMENPRADDYAICQQFLRCLESADRLLRAEKEEQQ